MNLFRSASQHRHYSVRCYPEVGELVPAIGNCSEVMMHMRLDDKPIEVELVGNEHKMVQHWVDHRKFSFEVTTGEGGFYCRDHEHGVYYTYADESRLTAEQLASIQPGSEEAAWLQSTLVMQNGECSSPNSPITTEPSSSTEIASQS
jgi:hypothetical protein